MTFLAVHRLANRYDPFAMLKGWRKRVREADRIAESEIIVGVIEERARRACGGSMHDSTWFSPPDLARYREEL